VAQAPFEWLRKSWVNRRSCPSLLSRQLREYRPPDQPPVPPWNPHQKLSTLPCECAMVAVGTPLCAERHVLQPASDRTSRSVEASQRASCPPDIPICGGTVHCHG